MSFVCKVSKDRNEKQQEWCVPAVISIKARSDKKLSIVFLFTGCGSHHGT